MLYATEQQIRRVEQIDHLEISHLYKHSHYMALLGRQLCS